MLPEPKDSPSGRLERLVGPPIAFDVLCKLGNPVGRVSAGLTAVLRTGVPEATVDEYSQACAGKDDVGPDCSPAGGDWEVHAKTMTSAVELGAHRPFRLGVAAPVRAPSRARCCARRWGWARTRTHCADYRSASRAKAYESLNGAALPIICAHRPRCRTEEKSKKSGMSWSRAASCGVIVRR